MTYECVNPAAISGGMWHNGGTNQTARSGACNANPEPDGLSAVTGKAALMSIHDSSSSPSFRPRHGRKSTPNDVIVCDGERDAFLILPDGVLVLIDRDDLALVGQYRWHLSSEGYAQARPMRASIRRTLLMHRLLLGIVDDGRYILADHINGDKLDNRRQNLRIVDHSQNSENRHGARSDSRTGVRGVHFVERSGRYEANVWRRGVRVFHGVFRTIDEADAAVREARRRLMTHAPENRGEE